jgi:HEAT repeats
MQRAAIAFALLLVAGGAACKRTPPPGPAIVEVRVVDRTPKDDRLALDLRALEARARTAIARASGYDAPDGGAAACDGARRCYKLRVELRTEGAEDRSAGKGVLRAMVHAELSALGDVSARAIDQAAVGEREYEVAKLGDRTAAWRAHVERAVDDAVRVLGARVRLQTADAGALVAAIDGSDDDLREEAVRVAAERRVREVVPSLIKLLKSEDHELRDAAIGALGAIGDARAVKPLTEVAHFRDILDLPKVLDALALIGSDEARAYLEFVASGHESTEMRDLAKDALARLQRRARDAGR